MSVIMYQHGKRSKRKSSPKIFLQFAFILGISFIIVALLLKSDMASHEVEKTSVPIVTEVSSASEKSVKIDEPLFTMNLPEDWSQANRVQSHVANYYEWQSSKAGGNDRTLRLHIDIIPSSYKLVKMLPITANNSSFQVGNVSGNCIDFALGAGNEQRAQGNAPVMAKWQNVNFMCDPINSNQTIGTGTPEGSIGTVVEGSKGSHTYFFYYIDHNIRPDDNIFVDIVRSFSAK